MTAPIALVDCNKALSLSPYDPIFLDSRGYAYLRKGDFSRAMVHPIGRLAPDLKVRVRRPAL